MEQNELAVKPIKSLIIKFALPTIIALLVNSLYNIIDQIFVGKYAGYLGNGATAIIFPMFMFAMAIASCIAEGGSAYFSLQLGARHKKIAEKIVGNILNLLVVIPITLTILSFIFLEELLIFFGATNEMLPMAKSYGAIMLIGSPFVLFGMGMNSLIRADGSPKYAMISMLSGALLNLILDPIFIFTLNWGIEGAGWATVISELISFIISATYISKFKYIKIYIKSLKFSFPIVRKIFLYGISNFIISSAITFVIIAHNNALKTYGAQTIYGSNIPLSAYSIVAKVNQIFMSFIIGIGISLQPIVGFNFGAKNYKRVKETFNLCIKFGIILGFIPTVFMELFPETIIKLFGNGDALYYEFANRSFRIIFTGQIFVSIAVIISNFFRAIGRPWMAVLSAGSRFTIFFIPAIYFLPKLFALTGVLCVTPIAEFCSSIFSLWLIKKEMKKLNRLIKNEEKKKQLNHD